MNLDLSRFHTVFFNEAAEHLATLESLLLHLDAARPDPAQLEDLRRIAHSLKGSGATFGFRDLALLAEALETAFAQRVRCVAPLPPAAADALREAAAVLRRLLECARADVPADDALRASVQGVTQRLRAAAAAQTPSVSPATQAAPVVTKVSHGETAPALPASVPTSAGILALVEAAQPGQDGLGEITAVVRLLGEALERQAGHLEDAFEENARLREALDTLVLAVARLVLPGTSTRRPARPVPKLRRARPADGETAK